MNKYRNKSTGVIWTEDEIRQQYEMFKDEIYNGGDYFETFEEYMEYLLDSEYGIECLG